MAPPALAYLKLCGSAMRLGEPDLAAAAFHHFLDTHARGRRTAQQEEEEGEKASAAAAAAVATAAVELESSGVGGLWSKYSSPSSTTKSARTD